MYLYMGRDGNGYRWALWNGGAYVYMYERSSVTKWHTKYLGKVSLWRLPRDVALAFLEAAATRFWDFVESLLRLAAAHPAFRAFAEEYKEELEALGLLDDDG